MLISGIGVAGPALAYWLLHHGFVPTLIEQASQPRTAGYVIDFWGVGYDIAEQMGLLPKILDSGYRVREVRFVDRRGVRVGGFDLDVVRRATNDRYTSLPRGDLSAILYSSIAGRVETLFGDSVVSLAEQPDGVLVGFRDAAPRRFDLVVGADGLHSAVRRLTFGPEARFERFLGYVVAAFEAPGYRPRDEDVYVACSAPGLQVARFAMRDDRTLVLFVAADSHTAPADAVDPAAQKDYLRARLVEMGWESARLLAALDRCRDFYFDRVSQIRMPSWRAGRVALIGDAAFAPSLLAGQGAALAIIAAYVLAGELARASDSDTAFAAYESRLRPFIEQKQNAAARFAGAFAPGTRLGIFVRNQITKAFALPYVAKLSLGSTLRDDLVLPEYPS